MGDPTFVPGKAASVGSNANKDGVFTRQDTAALDAVADKTQSFCDNGDTFCASACLYCFFLSPHDADLSPLSLLLRSVFHSLPPTTPSSPPPPSGGASLATHLGYVREFGDQATDFIVQKAQ